MGYIKASALSIDSLTHLTGIPIILCSPDQRTLRKLYSAVYGYEERLEPTVLLEENFLQYDAGKWYIPDVTKEADVAKLREKKLLREFEGYVATKGKLKLYRAEAIRMGFAKLWAERIYKLII